METEEPDIMDLSVIKHEKGMEKEDAAAQVEELNEMLTDMVRDCRDTTALHEKQMLALTNTNLGLKEENLKLEAENDRLGAETKEMARELKRFREEAQVATHDVIRLGNDLKTAQLGLERAAKEAEEWRLEQSMLTTRLSEAGLELNQAQTKLLAVEQEFDLLKACSENTRALLRKTVDEKSELAVSLKSTQARSSGPVTCNGQCSKRTGSVGVDSGSMTDLCGSSGFETVEIQTDDCEKMGRSSAPSADCVSEVCEMTQTDDDGVGLEGSVVAFGHEERRVQLLNERKKLIKTKGEIVTLEMQNYEKDEKILELETELEKLRREVELEGITAKDDAERLQQELAAVLASTAEQEKRYRDQLSEKNDQLTAASVLEKSLRADKAEAQEQTRIAKISVGRLSADKDAISKELGKTKDDNEELLKIIAELREEMGNFVKDKDQWKCKNQTEKENLVRDLSSCKKQVDRLNRDIEKLKKENEAALDQQAAEIGQIREDLVKEQEKEVRKYKNLMKSLQTRLEQFEKDTSRKALEFDKERSKLLAELKQLKMASDPWQNGTEAKRRSTGSDTSSSGDHNFILSNGTTLLPVTPGAGHTAVTGSQSRQPRRNVKKVTKALCSNSNTPRGTVDQSPNPVIPPTRSPLQSVAFERPEESVNAIACSTGSQTDDDESIFTKVRTADDPKPKRPPAAASPATGPCPFCRLRYRSRPNTLNPVAFSHLYGISASASSRIISGSLGSSRPPNLPPNRHSSPNLPPNQHSSPSHNSTPLPAGEAGRVVNGHSTVLPFAPISDHVDSGDYGQPENYKRVTSDPGKAGEVWRTDGTRVPHASLGSDTDLTGNPCDFNLSATPSGGPTPVPVPNLAFSFNGELTKAKDIAHTYKLRNETLLHKNAQLYRMMSEFRDSYNKISESESAQLLDAQTPEEDYSSETYTTGSDRLGVDISVTPGSANAECSSDRRPSSGAKLDHWIMKNRSLTNELVESRKQLVSFKESVLTIQNELFASEDARQQLQLKLPELELQIAELVASNESLRKEQAARCGDSGSRVPKLSVGLGILEDEKRQLSESSQTTDRLRRELSALQGLCSTKVQNISYMTVKLNRIRKHFVQKGEEDLFLEMLQEPPDVINASILSENMVRVAFEMLKTQLTDAMTLNAKLEKRLMEQSNRFRSYRFRLLTMVHQARRTWAASLMREDDYLPIVSKRELKKRITKQTIALDYDRSMLVPTKRKRTADGTELPPIGCQSSQAVLSSPRSHTSPFVARDHQISHGSVGSVALAVDHSPSLDEPRADGSGAISERMQISD